MLLQSLLRSTAAASTAARTRNLSSLRSNLLAPTAVAAAAVLSRPYSKAKTKTTTKGKVRGKDPRGVSADDATRPEDASSAADDDLNVEFELPTDPLPVTYDPALDVGPGGRPLFSFTKSFSSLGRKDACTYVDLSLDEWKAMLPEGLPPGMVKEFEETRRCAVMVRQSFLDLRDNFRYIVDPPIRTGAKNSKRQIVLDGPVSCGKSITLAMLVHWARCEGWLVFYVPKGREWTHGGFFYRAPYSDLWDTPVGAAEILQDFLKFNESRLQQLPCQIFDPIPLGEGAGVGIMKGVDSMAMPEGSTLYDLIQTGIAYTHAAVGVVVRLRKELSLVKDIPVLFAIDQYNNWFTFSEYQEPVTVRSCRPIHARELSTVNAYRSMMHGDMMVGAFSHSTAVGKLRQELPDVPLDARVMLPRYNLDEAATVCHYYLRQRLIRHETFSEEKWKKIYYLSNGNGSEMRWLAPFI
ncbi:LOW QUALITY PROTEIN: 28S ribosomal protein S29, mitochondrial [Phoenix dactylifera]|uniref:Small ribosomal subunit protein mS29 n=1 Tax=Phoenix dactylifera TaxID=42345 RepID=A0A8B7CBR6_PHODC|nr:LOW QUALITY PROTEIN: 28S ribosomal protein S29, mitochondrial [Phoenix dactylifera]